jgi:hypothetical protein
MKIRCAYSRCRKLFEPSPSQRRDLIIPTHSFYCSQTCKCAAQVRSDQREVRSEPKPPSLSDHVFDVHVRVADGQAFRRLVEALDDSAELVKVRWADGRVPWALQRVARPPASGTIAARIAELARQDQAVQAPVAPPAAAGEALGGVPPRRR